MEFRETFQQCYEDCGGHDCTRFAGKPFTTIRTITEPDTKHDEEVLPMFEILCDGITFEAWPEEVLR